MKSAAPLWSRNSAASSIVGAKKSRIASRAIAASEGTTRMALALSHGSPDYGAYLNEAKTMADNQQLDFLEFVDSQGTIISSAQWPRQVWLQGHSHPRFPHLPKDAFLKQEELPDGAALGLFAVREVNVGENRFS